LALQKGADLGIEFHIKQRGQVPQKIKQLTSRNVQREKKYPPVADELVDLHLQSSGFGE
jgi:hypothetical protein